MALQGNEPKIRFNDMIYTVKQRIVTEIYQILKPYSQTGVDCETPVEPVATKDCDLLAIYFCPDCKQFFLNSEKFMEHLVEGDDGAFVCEKTGFPGQNKALKAWYAD